MLLQPACCSGTVKEGGRTACMSAIYIMSGINTSFVDLSLLCYGPLMDFCFLA